MSQGSNSYPVTVSIGSSASLSSAVQILGLVPVAIEMPAAWDAADLTLQFSKDGTTFNNVYTSSGSEKVITASTSRWIQLKPSDYTGVHSLKIRSGTAASAVTQTAARTLYLICRAFV
jgi:hypothetical protein